MVRADHDAMFIRRDGSLRSEGLFRLRCRPMSPSRRPGSVQEALAVRGPTAAQGTGVEKLSWLRRVTVRALDQDRFVLYSQPIRDPGVEGSRPERLLLRMVSPEGDIVEPRLLPPDRRGFGLISEIDRWVVGETARLADRPPRGIQPVAKSVVDPDMPRSCERHSRPTVWRPSSCCELTRRRCS